MYIAIFIVSQTGSMIATQTGDKSELDSELGCICSLGWPTQVPSDQPTDPAACQPLQRAQEKR